MRYLLKMDVFRVVLCSALVSSILIDLLYFYTLHILDFYHYWENTFIISLSNHHSLFDL